MKTRSIRRTLRERFEEKIRKDGQSGCWIWTGYVNCRGYGRIGRGGRAAGTALAHRVAYVLSFGEIPDDSVVCHKCDNPSCVNPEHLFIGTQADNLADMRNKGRQGNPIRKSGSEHHMAKLDEAAVLEIRRRYACGEQGMVLAVAFGVAPTNISMIIKRRTWTHV